MDTLEHFDCEQNTPEWLEARRGVVTASEFSTVLAKGRSGGESVTRRKYMLTLASEIITGQLAPSWEGNSHTQRGHALEDDARNLYAMLKDVDPKRVGFYRRGRTGASPDSEVDTDGLCEIKTKLPHLQLDLLDKKPWAMPPEHVAQVQGQLLVTGRSWCDFVSYWPGLPLFVVRIERDEAYIARLKVEIAEFVEELDTWVDRYKPLAA